MKRSPIKQTIIMVLHTLNHTGKISSYATKMNIMFKSFIVCKSSLHGEQWDGLGMVHLRVSLEYTYSYEPMFY